MKKIVVAILILVMVAGSLATVLYYLLDLGGSKDPFAGIPNPVIRSHRFANLAGIDASELDLSKSGDILHTVTFDAATKWPDEPKMLQGMSPQEIMEKGKYLGLGLKALHQEGFTGKGVSVAIFDKPIPRDHEAWPETMTYIEALPDDPKMSQVHFHGAACASILSGKDGVAPGVHLYYFAVPDDGRPYQRYAQAMEMLLERQSALLPEEKIRIVSVSHGIDPDALAGNLGGARDWADAIGKASEQGIMVVYPGMPQLDFTGIGSKPGKDRDDPESYEPWSWTMAKDEVMAKLRDAKVGSWDSARKELSRLLTADPSLDRLSAEAIDTFIYTVAYYKNVSTFSEWMDAMSRDQSGVLAVPADYLTLAGVQAPQSYTYYGSGGLSWSTPYLAGVLALGLEVNPEATPDELYRALEDTATAVSGMSVINPRGFVEALVETPN